MARLDRPGRFRNLTVATKLAQIGRLESSITEIRRGNSPPCAVVSRKETFCSGAAERFGHRCHDRVSSDLSFPCDLL